MDKFTVDLDQVLNDFEYRELTDQYNASAKVTDNSSPSVPNQNVTKHSINNVFHSLNEYLNTNINTIEAIGNNVSLEADGAFTEYSRKEQLTNEESKSDVNTISQGNDIQVIPSEKEDFLFNKDVIQIEEEHSNSNLNTSFNTNIETTSSSDKDVHQFVKDDSDNDILKLPFDADTLLRFESSENHIDLHTELQNVVGNHFGVNYEKNTEVKVEKELQSVIGFDQALYLDDQEINKLLSELEEDDEINIDTSHSELGFDNAGGCEIVNSEQNVNYEGMYTNVVFINI